ncbi:MAG: zinc ribbon domain-containing protein [Frankia sp.]|nr:zinc ribbon domain-containing protein [Frankia sp.]
MGLFTSTAPCPYCYTEINPRRLACRCSGRHAAGRPQCKRKPDPARLTHFGDSEPYLPVITPIGAARCPQCGADPGPPICPECHSLLPSEYGPDSALIGLVGVRQSGKTVMLSVLDHELQNAVGDRFNAVIDTPGGSSELARNLRIHHDVMLRADGHLPPQTAENSGTTLSKKAPAVYSWRYHRKTGMGITRARSVVFSFYDNAGEDFATPDKALSQIYLGATSGVILLLDPFGFPANRARATAKGASLPDTGPEAVLDAITLVLRTTKRVKRNQKIKEPLAVMISKIDAFFDEIPPDHPLRWPSSTRPFFDETESRTVHDHIGAMVEKWGGARLIRKLENNYANFRLFGASALGAEPDYASGRVNSRGLLPHRVAEPLLWLMATRGFIPTTGP